MGGILNVPGGGGSVIGGGGTIPISVVYRGGGRVGPN